MAGRPIATAFVRLRFLADPASKAEAEAQMASAGKGAEKGAAASGDRAGKGFLSSYGGQLKKGAPGFATEGGKAGASWGSKFGSQAGKATSVLAKVGTVALVAAAAASVKMATDFQASMKRVQTQAGASAADVKTLSAQVLSLGTRTQQGPQQLAESLYHLKSVGLDNVNAMKALKVSSDFAAVGNANLEETTNALAGAWRSGIKGAGSFSSTASTLNAIIGAGNVRMEDLNNAIGTGFLPSARSFGISLKSVGAALALMTDEGIPAEVAATRLRMSFSLLGAPSSKAADQLQLIGLSGSALANTMRGKGGLVATIGLLKEHLDASGLSATRQAQLLSNAFGGGRSSSAILTLINNYAVLQKKQEQINKSIGKFGPAVQAQRKTAGAAFALLRSNVEVLGIRIGTVLLPVVAKFALFLANSKVLIPGLVAVMGVLTAAILVQAAAWAVSPIGLVSIGIVALVAATVLLIKHWNQVWGVIGPVVKRIGVVFGVVAQIILNEWKFVALAVLKVIGTIIHAAAAAFGWVPGMGSKLRQADKVFSGFTKNVSSGFDTAIAAVGRWQKSLEGSGKTTSDVTKGIRQHFNEQHDAAKRAGTGIDSLSSSIVHNGVASDKSLGARDRLIKDMTSSGVRAHTARHDVADFTNAVANNGATSNRAQRARQRLIDDLLSADKNSSKGKRDLADLNAAVRKNGSDSDQARNARQRLIKDLENSGLNARDARDLVDKLSKAVRTSPTSHSVHLTFGLGVDAPASLIAGVGRGRLAKLVHLTPAATGGVVKGPGGPTDDKAGIFALSNEEYVVRARSHRRYGTKAMDAVNKGTATIVHRAQGGSGSVVQSSAPQNTLARAYDNVYNTGMAVTLAVGAQMVSALEKLVGSGGGEAIVRDAMRFIGRIPYVWGGTAVPGGADCSGFVQTIYGRHGISAPRTSEAQGAWVRRSAPVPGGLAFYNSPAGGPPPGHVAIIGNNGKVISQGGGLGPQYIPLHALPLMWTGIPPHGFPGGAGKFSGGHSSLGQLEQLWTGAGGPGGNTAHIAAAIALAESGGNANARNPSGASGLWQILGQVVRGNIFNPLVNAENAVTKWRDARGFGPWVTYTDGAYRRFMSNGGTVTEPVVGVGASGRSYQFHPGEEVTPTSTVREHIAALKQISRKLDKLILVSSNQGRDFGETLNGTSRNAAHRARHSVS